MGATYDVADLVDSMIDRRAIAFIGSGASAGARLPDWPTLLKELIETGFTRSYLNEAERDELTAWLRNSDYLMLADAIQDRLTRGFFQAFMANKFNSPTAVPTELHELLAELPFAAYVTTNFDRLLEHAWSKVHGTSVEVLTPADRSALRNPLGRGSAFLLKTHGCASKPESLVLGLQEFRAAIHDNRACVLLLQNLFLRHQLLFIGHSLTDPDLLFLLDQLVATFGVPPGRHFALVKDEDVGPLRARAFRANYGIEVLRYTATPGHPEVIAFLRDLKLRVHERRKAVSEEIKRKVLEELTDASPDGGSSGAAPSAPGPARHARPAGRSSAPTLDVYCQKYLGAETWKQLASWYDSLRGSTSRDLLRINLDRECEREDLETHIWQEFLRRLALRAPTPESPLAPLRSIVEEDPGLFTLRGKPLEDPGPLRRYLRYADFERMLARAPSSVDPALNGSALDNGLLGRPGHAVWCSDASYANVTDPTIIALDLWPLAEPRIVEIAYAPDILLPDDCVRVATVPDMYRYEPEFVNVKKPARGASDWCHTVRLDDPSLRDRAPSAVHAPLRLLAARTKKITLRTIGA